MFENFLNQFGADKASSIIVWLMVTYAVVFLCMIVDLIFGIKKAKARGEYTTSTGLRKTSEKAEKYFVPMVCLTLMDLLASVIIDFPVFTMLMGAYNALCEFWSVFESTHQKEEIRKAANTMQVIVKNRDDLGKSMVEVMKMMNEESNSSDKQVATTPKKKKHHQPKKNIQEGHEQ